ncbi:MAG: hypothetical protein ACP5JP_10310 [bacterium]
MKKRTIILSLFISSLLVLIGILIGCSGNKTTQYTANPYLVNSAWPIIHQSSYQNASSPFMGPSGSTDSPPSSEFIKSPVQGTGPVIFGSDNSVLFEKVAILNQLHIFSKLDPVTLNTITSYTVNVSASDPMNGLYSFVDYQNCWWNAYNQTFLRLCFKGSNIVPDMTINLASLFPTEITSDDTIVSMNPLYTSPGLIDIAFVTEGLAPVHQNGYFTQTIIGAKVGVMRINNDRSVELFIRDFPDEDITNSFAVTPDGGIYVVTDKHAIKLMLQQTCGCGSEALNVIWEVPYDTGLPIQPIPCSDTTPDWECRINVILNGGRLSPDGSGTTPTLMEQGEYMVFADGELPVKLVALRTTDGSFIPIDKPVPFTETTAQTENICASYGNKFIIENNYSPGVAGYEIVGPSGQEQVKQMWVNYNVFAPNAVPLIAGASNTVYVYEMQGPSFYPLTTTTQQWFVTAMDLNTGNILWRKFIGEGISYNSIYAPLSLDDKMHIYIGLFGGLLRVD